MTSSSVSRRDFIRWVVSSLVLAPVLSHPSSAAISRWNQTSVADQCDLLFGDHLPENSIKLTSQHASNVYAAIFESEIQADNTAALIRRWLCIASEVGLGKFSVQTSQDVIACSSSLSPVDVELFVSETGEVEVFQQGIRSNTRQRWHSKDGIWQLSESSSKGVSGGIIYNESYDQLRQEVVLSSGHLEDDVLSTERHLISKIFALGEYTRSITG